MDLRAQSVPFQSTCAKEIFLFFAATNLKRDNWDEIAVSHQQSAVSKELMADG